MARAWLQVKAKTNISMDVERYQHLVQSGLEVTHIKLARNAEEVDKENGFFHPDMCHQIFGKAESIYGYKELKLYLFYNASTFECFVSEHYIFKTQHAFDYMKKLIPWLPPDFFRDKKDFLKSFSKKKLDPFGIQVDNFKLNEGPMTNCEFEVYACNVSEPGYKEFHKRMETVIIWFIDAANFIDLNDDKWTFIILYEKVTNKDTNAIAYYPVGYSTVYAYFLYPDKRRYRISQFIIFPPFQRLGLGIKLLQSLYAHLMTFPFIFDITVEDPAERFQLMRDSVDTNNVKTLPSFSKESLKGPFTRQMATEAREHFKINEKQSHRLYDILRLFYISAIDEHGIRLYKKNLKARLAPCKRHYRRHYFAARQLDDDTTKPIEDEIDKLMRQYNRVCLHVRKDKDTNP